MTITASNYARVENDLYQTEPWAGNGETGTEDHAWYVWLPDPGARGRPSRMLWEGKRP